MPLSDSDRLRMLIGEVIPSGGTDTDTMFSNIQLTAFLTGNTITKAALEGWKAKAAEYSNLVTVAEGNSSRDMSDLHKAALEMVKYYEGLVAAEESDTDLEGRRGRVVIGEISRNKRYR